MKQEDIKEIKAGTYVGYIWKSDTNKPEVYCNDAIQDIKLNDEENPFIIEGQLYDKEKCVSYSIKYIDGKYIAKKFSDLEDEELGMNIPISYYANRMDNVEKLMFRQYWEAEQDDLCEGMEVLKPTSMVFVGFEKKEDRK